MKMMGAEAAKRRYVGETAFRYDQKRVKQPHWRVENDAVALLLGDARTVLDAPVGTGRFMPLYKEREVMGLDISEDMLVLARAAAWREGVRFTLTQCDLMKPLQLGVRAFDVAVIVRYLTLMHPDEMAPAFDCIARHAERVIVEVPTWLISWRDVASRLEWGPSRSIRITDKIWIHELVRI